MNAFKIVCILFALFLVVGCSVTDLQLKEDPAGVYEYTTNENYKTVYRRIIQGSKKCYVNGARRLESNLFEDNKTAEISLEIIYQGNIRALYFLEIQSMGESATKVTSYYSWNISDSWKHGAEDSEEWAAGNLDVCRYKNQ